MGNEIRVQSEVVYDALAELRSSIQALDTSFSKTIDGNNNLDIVDKINHIKERYDELLTKYEALLLQNVTATEEAMETYKEADEAIEASIR
ncbi:MAG TPA: YwqI/YxiC family protein [Pseudogracilibacillus sp.]|nr:YwqI/YxiC family protein [Pseudogracilibacillus sp.]